MPTETLRERVRERLIDLIAEGLQNGHDGMSYVGRDDIPSVFLDGAFDLSCAADAILREFRLQPVAVGKVTGEGEVEGL